MANYSKSKKYNLSCVCVKYTPFNIIWLNKLGGYDSYTFRLKSTIILQNTKSTWNRFLSSLKGNNWTYDIGERGISTYYSETIERVNVISTWLSEEEHIWILELFQSPEIFLIKDGNRIPVVVENNSVERRDKKGIGNRLLSHTIDFLYSYKIITQRG